MNDSCLFQSLIFLFEIILKNVETVNTSQYSRIFILETYFKCIQK